MTWRAISVRPWHAEAQEEVSQMVDDGNGADLTLEEQVGTACALRAG